MKDDRLKMTF